MGRRPHRGSGASKRSKLNSPVAREKCHYCKVLLIHPVNATTDHVVPLSRGGIDRAWNKVLACTECNREKASSWPTHDCPFCRNSIRVHAEWGVTEQSRPEGWVRTSRKGRTSYLPRALKPQRGLDDDSRAVD